MVRCRIRRCSATVAGAKKGYRRRCKLCATHGPKCYFHATNDVEALPVKKSGPECFNKSKRPLKDLQRCVVGFINSSKYFLVALGTGLGKTMVAITAAHCYLDEHPQNRVLVITPAALVQNFAKQLADWGPQVSPRIHIMSFENFMKGGVSCANTMLIIDEAHNLRGESTKRFRALLSCAGQADKRVLLSATPFVNGADDVRSLVAIMLGITPEEVGDVAQALQHLKNHVSYVMMSDEMRKLFPTVNTKRLFVRMSPSYEEKYRKMLSKTLDAGDPYAIGNPTTFLHGYRKAADSMGSDMIGPKLQVAVDLVGNAKTVMYSTWLQYGHQSLAKLMKAKGITYRLYDGKMTAMKRRAVLEDFNDNKFQVLVISDAGGTGLSTRGVRRQIIVDPPWNYAALVQIEGRVARMDSHPVDLPAKERNVEIIELVLVSSDVGPGDPAVGERWRKDLISGDVRMYNIIDKKKEEHEDMGRKLAELSAKC